MATDAAPSVRTGQRRPRSAHIRDYGSDLRDGAALAALLADLILLPAIMLVFDMPNEYGLDDIASDTGETVVGLRTKFPARVRVVGLGGGAQIRGQTADFDFLVLAFAEDTAA